METPRFTHDCTNCLFLGHYSCDFGYKNYDLYVCRNKDDDDCYVARYGDDGNDYMAFSNDDYGNEPQHPLREARQRYLKMHMESHYGKLLD